MTNREAFEEWWNQPPPCHNENTKLAAWEAWQAATANQDSLIVAAYEDAARLADTIKAQIRYAGTGAYCPDYGTELKSRTPADANSALDELLMKIAKMVLAQDGWLSEEGIKEIIERVKNG